MQRDPQQEEPPAAELHRTGTVANILRWITAPDGSHHLVCQGVQRFRVIDWLTDRPFIAADMRRLDEPDSHAHRDRGAVHAPASGQALEALQLLPQVPEGW